MRIGLMLLHKCTASKLLASVVKQHRERVPMLCGCGRGRQVPLCMAEYNCPECTIDPKHVTLSKYCCNILGLASLKQAMGAWQRPECLGKVPGCCAGHTYAYVPCGACFTLAAMEIGTMHAAFTNTA